MNYLPRQYAAHDCYDILANEQAASDGVAFPADRFYQPYRVNLPLSQTQLHVSQTVIDALPQPRLVVTDQI